MGIVSSHLTDAERKRYFEARNHGYACFLELEYLEILKRIGISDRYEWKELEYVGPMSVGIRFHDRNLSRAVFVKLVDTSDPEMKRRAFDEFRAFDLIASDFSVKLYDAKESRKEPLFLALIEEYVEGLELMTYIAESGDKGDVSATVAAMLYQILVFLRDLHGHGITHRDLKLNNMKCDSNGRVKVFDFGLAKGPEDGVTQAVIGTPVFAAPEQFQPGSRQIKITHAMDVFAFGVIAAWLYDFAESLGPGKQVRRDLTRALAERIQHTGEPLQRHMAHILNLHSKLLARIGLPRHVVDLLARCLAYDPEQRPTSHQLQQALRQYLTKDEHKARLGLASGKKIEIVSRENKRSRPFGVDNSFFDVYYDGYRFLVGTSKGVVKRNNLLITPGDEIDGPCVLTCEGNGRRRFFTFDVTKPEVHF